MAIEEGSHVRKQKGMGEEEGEMWCSTALIQEHGPHISMLWHPTDHRALGQNLQYNMISSVECKKITSTRGNPKTELRLNVLEN